MKVGFKVLIFVFFALLVTTLYLGFQYYQQSEKGGNLLREVPDISIYIPFMGDVNLYVNKSKIESYKTDGIRNQNSDLPYKYKEGSVSGNLQIIYGKYVRYENEIVSVNPKDNDFNYQFNFGLNDDVTCWPKFFITPEGNQIDLSDIWFDPRTSKTPLYLDGQKEKKWVEVYGNLNAGQSMVVVLNKPYDFNAENKPAQLAVVGCE